MIFTILTFRALGRTHIASKPCVAIAMLCFDSTVGFPWSVPVLKQQLTAGGVFLTHASLSVPSDAPPRRGAHQPCQGPGPPGGSEGRAERSHPHRRKPKLQSTHVSILPPSPKKPSAPAFGSKPSLTLRWALSQALPRQYSTRLTPGAGFGPSRTQPSREERKRESAPRLRGWAFPVAAGI